MSYYEPATCGNGDDFLTKQKTTNYVYYVLYKMKNKQNNVTTRIKNEHSR